jgi:membrane-bound lytic murein transglycosylase A
VLPPLIEVAPGGLSPLADDLDPASLGAAIEQSMEFFRRRPDTTFMVAGRAYTGAEYLAGLGDLLRTLQDARGLGAVDDVLRSRFRILKATGQGQRVRFTGYYTPLLDGALSAGGPFQYPLYGKPPDLMSFDVARVVPGCDCATGVRTGRLENGVAVPYYTRADIDGAGALRNRGLEIAWTDDPVALFFLHIQGSGQLLLQDGRRVHVNYAATNGRPFTSIGPVLAKRGSLPPGGGSMQTMRAYLDSHPDERDTILHENPRYTFFRLQEDGPFGSTQVKLTPGRSIATDPEVFPPGSLAYIRTQMPMVDPTTQQVSWVPLTRFVLNQDKGAAIKGPARVDVYFGHDEAAEAVAGRMSAVGELYFLVPRGGGSTSPSGVQQAGRPQSGAAGAPRRRPAAVIDHGGNPRSKTLSRPLGSPKRLPIRYAPS